MRFRKKRGEYEILVDLLRRRPDKVYITEQFMGTWSTTLNEPIFIEGNFRYHNQDQIDRIFRMAIYSRLV